MNAGYKNLHQLRLFLSDEDGGVNMLAGTPDYERAKLMVEAIERDAEAKKNV